MGEKFDLTVIGGGPGGYEAALEASGAGMRTAVIERDRLGGTCLNHGCIPTKTILNTAELYRKVMNGEELGLKVSDGGLILDMEKLQSRSSDVVRQLISGIELRMKSGNISVYSGTGTVKDRHHIKISPSDDVIETDKILVATGSVPASIPVPGADLPGVMTSDAMLECGKLFDHLIIIGGGVIGMEFASIYSSLGRRVTVLEAADRVLPGMDREIAQNLRMILKKRGVDIHTGSLLREILPDGEGYACLYREKDSDSVVKGDGILLAAGRRPCTSGLFDSESSNEIKSLVSQRGYISVDSFQQTAVPGIYAAGDVTGGIQLAHAATAQGRCAVWHMLGRTSGIRAELIPSCVYTSPEIASVGLTADEAKMYGHNAVSYKYLMSANGKSVLTGQERGFIKLTYDGDSKQILGAQMMCARASDMISIFTEAVANGLTLYDMAKAVFPHPTFSEGILEAVRGALKT